MSEPRAHGCRADPPRRRCKFWYQVGPILASYFWLSSSKSPYIKYYEGHGDAGLGAAERKVRLAELHDKFAPRVLGVILDLKGLYIKLGQVMSVRPDIVPAKFRKEFRVLQSDVPARPVGEIRAIVEAALGPVEDLFAWFDDASCGAASIGQAHRARVRATGEEVVVKVQYPDAAWMVAADISAIRDLMKLGVWAEFLEDDATQRAFAEFSKQCAKQPALHPVSAERGWEMGWIGCGGMCAGVFGKAGKVMGVGWGVSDAA